ncbi:ATPase, T2SS/T4P/T4SS family [Candidatus Riflebacteria bacterium]
MKKKEAGEKKTRGRAKPGDSAEQERQLIDMKEAIALLKTTRATFYRWLRSGKFKGMKLGRQWRFYKDDIERFLAGASPRIDLPADISPLEKLLCDEVGIQKSEQLFTDESRTGRVVSLMLYLGALMRASDIHLDSFGDYGSLRFRVDGILREIARIDYRLLPALIEQWKVKAGCDIHEKAQPQDGRILFTFPQKKETEKDKEKDVEKHLDMRVCFLPAGQGESVIARILDSSSVCLELERIDYAENDRKRLLTAIKEPWGLVVVSGPTGSGKTTVLYCCISELNKPEVKLLSVEDPIEYFIKGVIQVQINRKAGLTYTRGIRAIMRSDPDVIMIGQVMDLEALQIAQRAAMTGHLVLTTMHTDEAASALERMVNMGCDPFVIGDATKLILAQRLVRKLCQFCSIKEQPEPDKLDFAFRALRSCGLNWSSIPQNFKKMVGCPKCAGLGYRGRTVVAETLVITPQIGKAIRKGASVEKIRAIAIEQGMTSMTADGVRRAFKGETTLEEILRVVGLSQLDVE